MAHQFKVGDVVKLKSGGPKMTVGAVDGEHAAVIWFDAQGSLQGLSEKVHVSTNLLVLSRRGNA